MYIVDTDVMIDIILQASKFLDPFRIKNICGLFGILLQCTR